jgi:hypothetical protein
MGPLGIGALHGHWSCSTCVYPPAAGDDLQGSLSLTEPTYLFIYFILRHGAHGLWPKDEKESKKGETVTAAKETRKHINK